LELGIRLVANIALAACSCPNFVYADPSPVNKYLLQHGLPPAVAAAAVNPGFEDPFDARTDVTLDNQQYRLGPLHLMAGKLDWCLLRGCHVVQKAMGNSDYSASDHKWLCVAVQLL
jgi:hypothetical protein